MGRIYFPNQRIVKIHRWKPETGDRFSASGDLAIVNAIRRMNGNHSGGFLLWSVLRMNQDGFVMGMSDKHLLNEYGIKRKTYLFSWDVLIDAGFILQTDESGNRYDFYEYPEDHAKSPLKGLLDEGKSPETGLLKVPLADFQKSPEGSFKSPFKGTETDKGHIIDTDNNNIPPTPQGDVEAAAQRFESFWQEYPKRLKRNEAYKAFLDLNPDDDLFQKILDAVKAAKKSATWQEQRYIPYAAKWLRDHRWEDDYDTDKQVSFYDDDEDKHDQPEEQKEEPAKPKQQKELFYTKDQKSLIWVDITELGIYEGYKITTDGRVMDKDHEVIDETERLRELLKKKGIL